MNVLHQVVSAKPIDDKRILVSFENGVQGAFDCSPYMTDSYWDCLHMHVCRSFVLATNCNAY